MHNRESRVWSLESMVQKADRERALFSLSPFLPSCFPPDKVSLLALFIVALAQGWH